MHRTENKSWFEQNPKKTLLGVWIGSFALLALVLEVALRFWVTYNPGYYTAISTTDTTLTYPYGIIRINRFGFPDDEFAQKKSDLIRIGYFGDSVCLGVGAGHGYRISDLLKAALPGYEHMNFGDVGTAVGFADIDAMVDVAARFELDTAVYLFNLNDTLPHAPGSSDGAGSIRAAGRLSGLLRAARSRLDWLRGRSFLYTSARNRVKDLFFRWGYNTTHGEPQYEFYPEQHRDVIMQTAERVQRLSELLESVSVNLIVVLLPYEMQISTAAATRYAELGIDWEPGFIEGKTQKMLGEHLGDIAYLDATFAFADVNAVDSSRHDLGEYFVYNLGGRLDWNHPNRAGHLRIADYILESGILVSSMDGAESSRDR